MTLKHNTKKYNEFTLTAKLTAGKILAIKRALHIYTAQGSPVALDVLGELNTAINSLCIDTFGLKED